MLKRISLRCRNIPESYYSESDLFSEHILLRPTEKEGQSRTGECPL
jgi:hypothetical protein